MKKSTLAFLFIALAIGACFATWKLLLPKYDDEIVRLNNENSKLQSELDEYKQMELNREDYEKETQKFQDNIRNKLKDFPGGNKPEDEIVLAYKSDNVNKKDYLFINSFAFSEPSLIYATNSDSTESSTGSGEVDYQERNYVLYGTQTTMGLDCSYSGLKKIIKKIIDRNDKSSIDSVTVAYDESTGQLAGTLTENAFYVTCNSVEDTYTKPYKAPDITAVGKGTDDIFKSLSERTVVRNIGTLSGASAEEESADATTENE